MSTPPPRTRAVLSRERIVVAATEIVDEHGVDALTMRAVAARLDSGVMSLYRHVSGAEELLDLVLAGMTADVVVPPTTGDWRADLRVTARTMYEALVRRPQLTVLLTSRSGRGAGELPLLDHALGILREAGLSPRQAVLANHALGNLVAGAALWTAMGLGASTGADRANRRAGARRAAETAAAELANLRWAGEELFAGGPDDRFEAALDLVLAGLETWRATPPVSR